MNLQVYLYKKGFDTQKAERFLKERRVTYQTVDLKKHPLGKRELELFAHQAGGAGQLVDRQSTAVKSHPIAYTQSESIILEYLEQHPEFLRLPIIRDGRSVLVGFDQEALQQLINQGLKG